MRRVTLSVGFTVAALLGSSTVVRAQGPDPLVGTWKVNVVKSKWDPPSAAMKTLVTKHESVPPDGVKMTLDGVNGRGEPIHLEYTYKLNGTDFPYSANTTRAYTRIDDGSYEYVEKVDGKVTRTSKVVRSADGKTATQTYSNSATVLVWEKQ